MAYGEAAELLKSHAHPDRLLMIQMLLQDRYTVGELADACQVPSHTASEHLRLIEHRGLLSKRNEGCKAYYQIAELQLIAIMPALKFTLGRCAV